MEWVLAIVLLIAILVIAWLIYTNRDSALPEQMQLTAKAEIERDEWKKRFEEERAARRVSEADTKSWQTLYDDLKAVYLDAIKKRAETAPRDQLGAVVDGVLQEAGTPAAATPARGGGSADAGLVPPTRSRTRP